MPIHGLDPKYLPGYPPHFDVEKVIRPNILSLHPYRCARDDYQEGILLDANENALGHAIDSKNVQALDGDFLSLDLHRYPDPAQNDIKRAITSLRGLDWAGTENVFLGVGSDEVIDLLMRVCVKPGVEKILITPPTYGMYAVCAQVNDVGVVKVPLKVEGGTFQLQVEAINQAVKADPSIKMIFICSPGNPTGTLIPLSDVQRLLDYEEFTGIVVVDEAYIDFSPANASATALVPRYANVVVMQTLSKSFGLAAIRMGFAIAQPAIIQVLTNAKAPYNISLPTSKLALSALSRESVDIMRQKVATLISSRGTLLQALSKIEPLGVGKPIGANNANFVLVPILNRETRLPDNARSHKVYIAMAEEERVVVRFRGKEYGCDGCLRITVGSEDENRIVIQKLEDVLSRL